MIGDAVTQLETEGLACNAAPLVGAMIELPSAVECAADIARVADFISIGSNDLVMYLLAVDRSNEYVERLYQANHPAVLRALKRLVDAARSARCPISICGEAAGDPVMLKFLVGIGIRCVSADPGRLPGVRRVLSSLRLRDAERFARVALSLPTARETAELFDSAR